MSVNTPRDNQQNSPATDRIIGQASIVTSRSSAQGQATTNRDPSAGTSSRLWSDEVIFSEHPAPWLDEGMLNIVRTSRDNSSNNAITER